MKKAYSTPLHLTFGVSACFTQLSGPKNILGYCPTLSAGVTDLNTQSIVPGGVVFNVATCCTECITNVINSTSTGTAANPITITIQKSGTCYSNSNYLLNEGAPIGGVYQGLGVTGNNFDATFSSSSYELISYSITDLNGCTGVATDTIFFIQGPLVTFSLPFDTVCSNSRVVQFTGGLPVGGVYSGPSVSSGLFDPSIGNGTYTISYSITDSSTSCSSFANNQIFVDNCLNLDQSFVGDVLVYPNPTSGDVIIEVQSENTLIEMFDAQGKMVLKYELQDSDKTILNIFHLDNGIYTLCFYSENTLPRIFKLNLSK